MEDQEIEDKELEEDLKNKENKENKDSKENKRNNKNKKSNKKVIISICVIVGILVIAAAIVGGYFIFRPKFKNLTIELGTEKIEVSDFLVSDMYSKNAEQVTDLTTINLNEVQETDITLKYRGKEETVKLNIVDTTAPKVEFKEMTGYLDYEIKADDFIKSKEDLSEMTVKVVNDVKIEDYGEYPVTIKVSDKYGNETVGETKLLVTWLLSDVKVELGDEFSVKNVVIDEKRFGSLVEKSEIEKVNPNKVGTYEIKAEVEGKTYTSKVTVQDTTPPELKLKDISIWNDQKIKDYKDFIVKASDISGEPKTELKTDINFSKIGKQEVIIEATDVNGNKVEKTAKLTIKKDTVGPLIYGLKELTVKKHSNVNYTSGVSARDEKDGKCDFTVDSSKVNVDAAGTYYATYISSDKSKNKTTLKRKIVVEHDKEDTNKKITEFYNKYCAGKDAVGISLEVRSKIKYNSNWGGSDPAWYGLTNGMGNCMVHATILQSLLQKAGYSTKMIWLEDKSHYWNLVNVGGTWWHIDGTPSPNHTTGLLTSEQKLADKGLHGKKWSPSIYPLPSESKEQDKDKE